MIKLKEAKKILKEIDPFLKEKFKVKKIGIFGSYVTGKQKKASDLDVLVEFSEPIGLFAFIELEYFLKRQLGIKVDLVMKDALKPRIRKRIIQETVYA
jgi:predicted nucleotidyltransferase